MAKQTLLFLFLFLLCLPYSYAADAYKPYLHTPSIPDHPQVRLFGQYNTLLFPGAATYSYPLELPPGTHGMSPSITLYYNSQAVQQRPGILGAGWSFNQNYIYRDVNSTPSDVGDDKYVLIFQNSIYELVYDPSELSWRTEVDYHFRVQNLTGAPNSNGRYWALTTKDGTNYRFGYTADAELSSSSNGYALRWSADKVTDTYGNTVSYAYLKDPYANDYGAQYLSRILYNSDETRSVQFMYEGGLRPDQRLIYSQGALLAESRRLTDVVVSVNSTIVRRYHLTFGALGPSLSTITSITRYGADNSSVLHTVNFSYHGAAVAFTRTTQWGIPINLTNVTGTDLGVRIVDLNNDGFSDILQGRNITNGLGAWLNGKTGGWLSAPAHAPPVCVVDAIGNDTGVRFADVNNDGLVDLLFSRSNVSQVYLNNGSGWINASTAWRMPMDIVDSAGRDQGVQLIDVDADGRVDMVRGKAGIASLVYLNNGSGWRNSTWLLPVVFTNGTDTGARFADVNGDGLPDILQANETGRNTWMNNGTGWIIMNGTWTLPVTFTNKTFLDTGARIMDINGDGLADIIQNMINGTILNNTWLNNGTGWSLASGSLVPDAMQRNGSNIGRRLADLNGDGFVDVIVADNQTNNYAWITNTITPFLLANITSEYGGMTHIDYTTSTRYNNTVDGVSGIGFNIFVVDGITKTNRMSVPFGTEGRYNYSYAGGVYNYEKREFRGFNTTAEQQPGALVYHYFYQDSPRRGKERMTTVYNLNGSLLSKNIKEYNYTYANGVYNLTVLFSSDYHYDGTLVPRVMNTTYLYDWFGNPLSVREHGDLAVFGDERITNYIYAYNKDAWILDKAARVSVYDAAGDVVRRVTYYYDSLGYTGIGVTGGMTRKEEWNNAGDDSFVEYSYDTYGNSVSSTDSAGSTWQTYYDATHTYPAVAINPLGHITYYSYDPGTGNVLTLRKNDITTMYVYDTHGRVIKEVLPYDTVDMPTKRYSYGGMLPFQINVSSRTTANNLRVTRYHYDGFANLVQLIVDRDSDVIVKNIYYDGSGRPIAEDNPYVTTSPLVFPSGVGVTNYTYDALNRIVIVVNPDGKNKTTIFLKGNITDFDENGHKHNYVVDALGRIVSVHEYNRDPAIGDGVEEYVTTYSYDGNDNLVMITDAVGNRFNFTYDSLGRKIRMEDPDMGVWTYSYDTRGNLMLQNDSRGQTIRLVYDALNRVIAKNSTDVNITFSYDSQYRGTLSNLTMTGVIARFLYDDRLRLTGGTLTVNGIDYATSYLYDSQDRMVSEEGLSDVDYLFDKQGGVKSIPGFVNATFDAFGSLSNRTYNNGLVSLYTYNSSTHRLSRIYIGGVQDLQYSYDDVGNILSINDLVQNKLSNLSYDSLDRLVSANVGGDRYLYRYSSTGNMMGIVRNNQSKKFVYAGLAHAPSSVIDGGSGVDVHHVSELFGSKNRTVEFFVLNDLSVNISGVNVSVNFGDGRNVTKSNITINNSLLCLVQNNYTYGGDYRINVSVSSFNSSDYEVKNIKFGVRARSLSIIDSNVTERTVEFKVQSDVADTLFNVTWNCTNNITTLYSVNLSNSSYLFDYLQINYSSPGMKTFTCMAGGRDGNESRTIAFTIDGLDVGNYDVLVTNISRRVIGFTATNSFNPLTTNISVVAENASFSTLVNISNGEDVMVFAEINNTVGPSKMVQILLSSNDVSSNYTSIYALSGVVIDNYKRIDQSNITKVLFYDVRNTWFNGTVSWNLTEPNIANSTRLDYNRTLLVIVQHDYTQGDKRPVFTASSAGTNASIRDAFNVRSLALTSLQTLFEGVNTTTELVVWNYAGGSPLFTWKFDTGVQNITNTSTLNQSMMLFIQSKYSASGVYRTRANINASNNLDNRTGLVIV